MAYVEWLRVRNCLRVLVIVLGVLFVIAGILRITAGTPGGGYGWVFQEEGRPGVHVVKQQLRDGSTRTTIDDPSRGDHIVIVDRGWQGRTITISGRNVGGDTSDDVQIGSVGINSSHHANGNTVEINTNQPVTARILLAIAAFVALIIGTILAAPLAKENSNHLEIAWTKPVSRTVMALGMLGVDTLGILASMVLTIIFAIAVTALFEMPRIVIDPETLPALALCVLAPIAWYDLLTAASASMKRGYGAVLGLGWFIALIVPPIGVFAVAAQSPIIHFLGEVFSVLTLFDPVAYLHLSTTSAPGNGEPSVGFTFGVLSASTSVRAAMALVLAIIYTTLSLLQWRRLEA